MAIAFVSMVRRRPGIGGTSNCWGPRWAGSRREAGLRNRDDVKYIQVAIKR